MKLETYFVVVVRVELTLNLSEMNPNTSFIIMNFMLNFDAKHVYDNGW